MNCIILEKIDEVREGLATVLLSMGIKGVPVASKDEALKAVREGSQVEGAILDVDNRELGGIELIKELKGKPETRNIKIIIHTVQSSREFVVQMVEMGIHGYILKPYNPPAAAKMLQDILISGGAQGKEYRQHIRVMPDPNELLRLHFKSPHLSQLITGKIRNISMGGVALELFNPPPETKLPKGQYIQKLQFTLTAKPLSPAGTIVLFKGNILAFRFESLSEEDRHNLARYIYKQLSFPIIQREKEDAGE